MFSHLDENGAARMVDVTAKPETLRVARASASLVFGVDDNLDGGSIEMARVAGLLAASRTPQLIPLCHPIPICSVEVTIEVGQGVAVVESIVTAIWKTGVEMEALTVVTVAALALRSAAGPEAVIAGIELLEKAGGRSGSWGRLTG